MAAAAASDAEPLGPNVADRAEQSAAWREGPQFSASLRFSQGYERRSAVQDL